MRRLVCALVVLAIGAAPATVHGAEAWQQPETLSQAGTSNGPARLATNSPGVAALVWTEFANGRTPRFRIRASVRQPDGAWSASEQLSGTGEAGSAAVGVDPQGRITAVWDEANSVRWADKAPGQPWSAGQAIPDGAGGKPDLFVASDGTATAVWQQGTTIDTYVIRTARRPLGGAWSSVETISPAWSYRPHIEGDTAGDVTVSYTHEAAGFQRSIYAVDRPNSGPWGAPLPISISTLTDNISDLVVAPASGAASVFWQNGDLSAPLAARTRSGGTTWATAPAAVPVSGSTAGRLDLGELDRAAVDGTGLVTAVWVAAKKVLTAYRSETTGTWAAPATPVEIDPGDGTTVLGPLTVASNAFGRALAAWTAAGSANRYALRGPGPGTPWSAPKPIDGVPADALPLDAAIDDTGRVAYAWSNETAFNVDTLAVSTYGNALSSPQPPAPPGPAPPAPGPSPPSPPPSSGGSALKAGVQGTPTTAAGVTFVVTSPGAGTASIAIDRAAPARRASAAATKYRRIGVVSAKLKKGRNVIRVRRVKQRKLARGNYRATITAKVGGRKLKSVRATFRIRR